MKMTFPVCMAAALTFAAITSAQAQPGGRPGGRGGQGFGGGGGFLLAMPEVQKELGVTDDQKALLEDMQADMRQRGGERPDFGSFRDLSPEEREKRLEEMRKAGEERAKQAEDALKAILNETQFQRYTELQLQRQGLMALNRAEVQEKLALTAEQKTKLEEIRAANRPERGQFGRRPEGQPAGERPDFQAMAAQARERREKAEADTLAVLTPEQKAKWEQLQGKKFEFPQPTFGRRGGEEGGNRPPRGQRGNNNNNNN